MAATPLLGRDGESHTLSELIDNVAERGDALLVRDEAGIGKTALLATVSRRATERGLRVLTASEPEHIDGWRRGELNEGGRLALLAG